MYVLTCNWDFTNIIKKTRNLYYSGAYKELGVDNSFSLENFKEEFKIHLISCDDETLVFDMVGVDAPVANALRRILIAEVFVLFPHLTSLFTSILGANNGN